jgi:hypothetical protein
MNDDEDIVAKLHREAVERHWAAEETGRRLVQEIHNAAVDRYREEQLKADELIGKMHRAAVDYPYQAPTLPIEPATISYTELPEAKTDSPLYREWNTYRHEAGRLLAEVNSNRHVLIKGDRIVGIWNTHDEALAGGYREFPGQPFLVHQIQERERVLRCLTVRRWTNLPLKNRRAI